MDQFASYLSVLRNAPATPVPTELLDDPRFTELVDPVVEVHNISFSTKFEAGKYLTECLRPLPPSRLRIDLGIWAWLSIWFLEQLCPADGRGHRKPLENGKYIPRPGNQWDALNKHLLFFPWKMVLLHGNECRCFLGGQIGKDTRAQREWTDSNRFNVITPLVSLAANIYGKEDKQSLKRGAASDKRKGNLRRFVRVATQLEVTYDVSGMNRDELASLLPASEFGNWL
jgi:hypothetical protein